LVVIFILFSASNCERMTFGKIKLNTPVKSCPVCNSKNEENAPFCVRCGTSLNQISTQLVGVPNSSIDTSDVQIKSFIDPEWIPENGIGIQVAGETQPIYVPVRNELVIGRTVEYTSPTDDFLDLSNLNAGNLGVSRKHVMIRQTESGYEVMDLTSRNGSWLNNKRLVPNRAYPLKSGSILRIGHMHLLIMYRKRKSQ